LRRWLNEGDVSAPSDGESVNLYGKIGVLVAGKATGTSGGDPISAPALLDMADAIFSDSAKVYIRES